MIRCYWLNKAHAAAASRPDAAIIGFRRARRRICRAAPLVLTCVTIGAPLGAAVGLPFLLSPPSPSLPAAATGGIGNLEAPGAAQPIPEPGSIALLATAVAAFLIARLK